MSRRRVLHLADSPYFGGINSHILSVAEAFEGNVEWGIVVATLPGKRDDDTLFVRAKAAGIDVATIAMNSTFDMSVRQRLRDYVDANDIAIVHTHAYRANVIANLSRLDVPVVTTSHGLAVQPTIRLRLWQAMHLRFMRGQAEVIACSEHVARQLRGKGVPWERITVILNAGGEVHSGSAPRFRAELGIAESARIALYVGRLDPGKRLDQIISTLEKMPQWHLLIVGDGPQRAVLERLIHERVTFCGAVSDPSSYYALADVVVLPTEMEALPMTLIEAAAHGKPAIASNVGGVSEVIVDDETGVLVEGADAWVEALNRLSDADTRACMGAAALERHRAHFSLAALRQSLSTVYSRVAS